MKRLAAAAAACAAVVGFALGAAPAGACACGIAIDGTVTEESALVIERPGAEEIILSLDLTSDGGDRAAIVVPVPGAPEVSAVRGGDPLAYLEEVTMPEPTVGASPDGGGETAGAPPVEVIDEQRIGGYQVARLEAGDAAALNRWLNANDYTMPTDAEPILADYVEEEWKFVAVRLAPGAEGRLKPLSISFTTDEVVYPMKLAQLGTEPIDITLYTLADGPRTTRYLTDVWGGEVAELDPQPPPALAELFAAGGYVTRLEAAGLDPSAFTEDLPIEPAPAPAVEEVASSSEIGSGDADDGISSGVVIAMIAAGLAFALALGVATRR